MLTKLRSTKHAPPETDVNNVSYKILPYYGKKIETYCKTNKIEKLKDIPKDLLQSSRKDYAENYHQIIQEAKFEFHLGPLEDNYYPTITHQNNVNNLRS